ncbi:MAG: DinB family protein [Flavobacteriaceae bacterium]|nr:DinB family protein [Flavobacteriaceae bacterium]
MKKTEITNELKVKVNDFISFINILSHQDFEKSVNNKWSPGQQLEHVYLSTKPIEKLFLLPKLLLHVLYGRPKRPSRSYNEIVRDYQKSLISGGKAPSKFMPKHTTINEKERVLNQLNHVVNKLVYKFSQKSEEELDDIFLPHPLLGKVTLRELYLFNIYHILHHHNKTEENLAKVN